MIDRVGGGIDLYRGAEENVIADRYRANVEDDAVEVKVAPFADKNIESVIAVEGRLYRDSLAPGTE